MRHRGVGQEDDWFVKMSCISTIYYTLGLTVDVTVTGPGRQGLSTVKQI